MVGLMESAFSMIFWAMKSREDCGMPEICPWDREDSSYEGYEVSQGLRHARSLPLGPGRTPSCFLFGDRQLSPPT
jgi:hypothetical protein